MKRSGILAALSFSALPSVVVHGQVPRGVPGPPPIGQMAPQLSPFTEKQVRPILATQQHCELKVENKLRLVATEDGRYAVAIIDGTMSVLPYQGRNPLRYGGRFLASPAALDVWISVKPYEDKSLAKGLPRNVSVMVNGFKGNSSAYPATYTCNY